MKQLLLLFICPALCHCQANGYSKTERVSDDVYEFTASFKNSETKTVQRYLNKKIATGNVSFVNTQLDATITLDNGMTFYIQSRPGFLKIVFDRTKNTNEHYLRMKKTCERISELI